MPKVFVTGGNGQLAYAYSQLISSNSNLSYMRRNYNVHILSKNLLDITNLEHFKSYIKKTMSRYLSINRETTHPVSIKTFNWPKTIDYLLFRQMMIF